jgi:hypothetical protein
VLCFLAFYLTKFFNLFLKHCFNMKKQIFKGLFVIAALSVGLWACKKDVDNTTDTAPNAETEYKIKTPQEVNEARTYFAKTLSKAIVNAEFREYIHEKMKLRYTTDYEFVWIAEKDKKLKSGKKVSALLAEFADKSLTDKYGSRFFDEVVNIDPLIAISFPEREIVNINNWNVNTVPDVAAIMDSRDISKGEFFVYDKTGNPKLDSRGGEPTAATLLVWEAEGYYLIDKKGITTKGAHIREYMPKRPPTLTGRNDCDAILLDANEAMDHYELGGGRFFLRQHNLLLKQYNDCLAATPVGTSTPTVNAAPDCERDPEVASETLHSFKINGWGTFDAIANQFWETTFIFHADIAMAFRNSFGTITTPSNVRYVSPGFDKDDIMECQGVCTGKLKGAFYEIWSDWDRNVLGDPIQIIWSEVDNATTNLTFNTNFGVTFGVSAGTGTSGSGNTSTSGSTASTTFGVNFGISRAASAKVELGSQFVQYCNPLKKEYNTGSITFFMRHP